jgi:hypothetical protein
MWDILQNNYLFIIVDIKGDIQMYKKKTSCNQKNNIRLFNKYVHQAFSLEGNDDDDID